VLEEQKQAYDAARQALKNSRCQKVQQNKRGVDLALQVPLNRYTSH
jgi:hypothetical protein